MNINKAQTLPVSFVLLALVGGFLFPSAHCAGAQPLPAPKPVPKRAPLHSPAQTGRGSAVANVFPKPVPPSTGNTKPDTVNQNPKQDGAGPDYLGHHHDHKIVPVISVNGQANAEADLLRKAYIALSKADHDYDWHRFHAMRQTADAAKILGETLAGDGHDREAQTTSDDELRAANGFLESARSLAASHKRPHVVEHINAALRQISIALKIR